MGFEPTTFTLATCSPTNPNDSSPNELANPTITQRSAGAARSAENRLPAPIDGQSFAQVDRALKSCEVALSADVGQCLARLTSQLDAAHVEVEQRERRIERVLWAAAIELRRSVERAQAELGAARAALRAAMTTAGLSANQCEEVQGDSRCPESNAARPGSTIGRTKASALQGDEPNQVAGSEIGAQLTT